MRAQALAQLSGLAGLERQIARAGAKDLASIRNEVTAYVAATQAFLQQAPQAVTKEPGAQALYAASAAAREAVADFSKAYYEQRIFDPYLKFASAEEEEAYQRREIERQRAIEKAQAEGTPEGDLRATQLALEQIKDAGAHGADRSPDYQHNLDKLQSATQNLELVAKEAKAPQQKVDADILAAFRDSVKAAPESDAVCHGLANGIPASPSNGCAR